MTLKTFTMSIENLIVWYHLKFKILPMKFMQHPQKFINLLTVISKLLIVGSLITKILLKIYSTLKFNSNFRRSRKWNRSILMMDYPTMILFSWQNSNLSLKMIKKVKSLEKQIIIKKHKLKRIFSRMIKFKKINQFLKIFFRNG